MCWGQGGSGIVGVTKDCLVQPETQAMRGSPSLTLPRVPEAFEPSELGEKMIPKIYCYTYRWAASTIVLREDATSNRWKQMQRPTDKH